MLLSSVDFFQNELFQQQKILSNSLDPDQAGHFVRPDLGTKCLQMLSADGTSCDQCEYNRFPFYKSYFVFGPCREKICLQGFRPDCSATEIS